MKNLPVGKPQVRSGSEEYREWLARAKAEAVGEKARRDENRYNQEEIRRLEALPAAELREYLVAVWEDYQAKHRALRGGDDGQIRTLELAGTRDPLGSQQAEDAIDLARVLAVLWERGETWAPGSPVVMPVG
jgi:hypothetical protein